jgi:hypothetical protein
MQQRIGSYNVRLPTTGVLLQLTLVIGCILDYHSKMLILTAAVPHLGICTDYFVRLGPY